MRTAAAFLGVALLAGCAAGTGQSEQGENPAELSARLAGATFGRVPGPPVSCITIADVRASRALSDQLILFDGADGRQWVNRAARCPALSYNRTVRLQNPTAQLCRGQAVEVVDRRGSTVYGTCTVGDFLSYVPRG